MSMVEQTFEKLTRRMPGMSQAPLPRRLERPLYDHSRLHPVLDRVDGIEGLYLSVGFSGHGFKLSPMIVWSCPN